VDSNKIRTQEARIRRLGIEQTIKLILPLPEPPIIRAPEQHYKLSEIKNPFEAKQATLAYLRNKMPQEEEAKNVLDSKARTMMERKIKQKKKPAYRFGLEKYDIEYDRKNNLLEGNDKNFGLRFGNIAENSAYYDGRYAVCLTKRGKLVGIATFNIEEGIYGIETKIEIVQIQGNKGTNINNPNWRKALVFEVEELARELGVNKVTVRSAHKNPWPIVRSNSKPGQKGYNAYDQTAIESGYEEHSIEGIYEKRMKYEMVLVK
jgi:hypothetical protein